MQSFRSNHGRLGWPRIGTESIRVHPVDPPRAVEPISVYITQRRQTVQKCERVHGQGARNLPRTPSSYPAHVRSAHALEQLGAVYNYQGQNRATGNSDPILDGSFVTTWREDGVRVNRALILAPRSWRLTANFEF